jgi:7,8-dihydro-6-hydroxymethylpterin-pyrophosphokinase
MTIEEIKTIFGIDITEKKRMPLLVALRAFYAVKTIKQLKKNKLAKTSLIYESIALEINSTRTMVYKLIEKEEYFKNDAQYSKLFLAFKNKDKSIFNEFINDLAQIRKNNRKNYFNDCYSIRKRELAKESLSNTLAEIEAVTNRNNYRKLNNLDIATFLRANNDLKSPAWDIPVKEMTSENFEAIKKINPEMFEQLVNSKL